MNLDKYIRIQLSILSKKYDISVVELTSAKDGKVSKNYTVHLKNKDALEKKYKKQFNNKKELVSWLICLD